jgi:hypothetical protein
MLTLALISLGGRPALVSPNDDDPLVWQDAVGELRRERSKGPSPGVEGGGDASQVDIVDEVEYERPYFGPSHVEVGGGDVLKLNSKRQSVGFWKIQDPIP